MNRKHKRPQRRKDSITENARPENSRKRTRLTKAKVKQITRRRVGNQAAYEQCVSEELCDDLARKFGRRDDYSSIAAEFVHLRSVTDREERCSLVMLLLDKYETDDLLREFLGRWDKHIYNYIFASIHGEDYLLQACGCVLDAGLMRLLATEYLRDRKTLMLFLSAAFKRWRKIYAPDSLWRVQLVTQQIAPRYNYNRKAILEHLQTIGAVPNTPNTPTCSWL